MEKLRKISRKCSTMSYQCMMTLLPSTRTQKISSTTTQKIARKLTIRSSQSKAQNSPTLSTLAPATTFSSLIRLLSVQTKASDLKFMPWIGTTLVSIRTVSTTHLIWKFSEKFPVRPWFRLRFWMTKKNCKILSRLRWIWEEVALMSVLKLVSQQVLTSIKYRKLTRVMKEASRRLKLNAAFTKRTQSFRRAWVNPYPHV